MEEIFEKIDSYYCTNQDELMITVHNTPIITDEFIEKIKYFAGKHGVKIYNHIKASQVNGGYGKFLLKTVCESCEEPLELAVTKSGLILIIKDSWSKPTLKCNTCVKHEEHINTIIDNQREEKMAVEREKNTDEYIDKYLDPNMSFKDDSTQWGRFNQINRLDSYSHCVGRVTEYIKGMKYSDFLKTPYWKVIAMQKKKKQNFMCQLCTSKKNLETHHSTYDILGEELNYMEKLTVLCHDCHSKYHK